MYLNKLLIKDFGKFNNKEISLKPGINVIYGDEGSGKTTISEFIKAMLYGFSSCSYNKGENLSYEQYKPEDKNRGYSGKAYIKKGEDNYFVERSFSRKNSRVSVLDVGSGREIKVNGESLKGKLFELPKDGYVNGLCIDDNDGEYASYVTEDFQNLMASGATGIDIDRSIASLREKKSEYDTTKVERNIEELDDELTKYEGIDDKLKEIRKKIKDTEDELAIETARRKRAARRLIQSRTTTDEEDGEEALDEESKPSEESDSKPESDVDPKLELESELKSEEKAEEGEPEGKSEEVSSEKTEEKPAEEESEKTTEKIKDKIKDKSSEDEIADGENKSLFLDAELLKDYKPKKKLTDRIWFIILTGFFVIGVITAFVYMLPFETAVRQIFIICTILFVIVTIVEGLYAKGVFEEDVITPSDEEFKRIIYELERKTETYEEVEIDMSFAKEYLDRREGYSDEERVILKDMARRDELREERQAQIDKRTKAKKELHAINLAINTINELSAEIFKEYSDMINENASEIVARISGNRYKDLYINDKRQIMVKDTSGYINLSKLDNASFKYIYLAIRLAMARYLISDRMPLMISDVLDSESPKLVEDLLKAASKIDTEQLIVFTSDKNLVDTLDEGAYEYNLVRL